MHCIFKWYNKKAHCKPWFNNVNAKSTRDKLQTYRFTVVFLHSYIFIRSGFKAVFIPANKLLESNKLVCIYEIKKQSWCYITTQTRKKNSLFKVHSAFSKILEHCFKSRWRSFNVTGNQKQRKCSIRITHEMSQWKWDKEKRRHGGEKGNSSNSDNATMPSVWWHNSFINELWHTVFLPLALLLPSCTIILIFFHLLVPIVIQQLTF